MERGMKRMKGGSGEGGGRHGGGCWKWRSEQSLFLPSGPQHFQPGHDKPLSPADERSHPCSGQGTGSPVSPPH